MFGRSAPAARSGVAAIVARIRARAGGERHLMGRLLVGGWDERAGRSRRPTRGTTPAGHSRPNYRMAAADSPAGGGPAGDPVPFRAWTALISSTPRTTFA